MNPMLEIKNIGKQYRLRGQESPYLTLREAITNFGKKGNPDKNRFWALKNISFDVNPGESIGIIGRNGAGKSTLLKVLSRITPPTEGEIISRGRVASLLEVGTGFHPELTGHENIFLNGSILGLTKTEIKKKFDEIVDFSGVEKFLDTPLKHYSSGMQLRLAFSVAAHLEPEVLVIDEVLAVGDIMFQRKCMNKMDDVSKSGRTILFVSHNMAAIKNLCKKTVLLDQGKMIEFGESNQVVEHFMNNVTSFSLKKSDPFFNSKCGRFKLKTPYWIDENEKPIMAHSFGQKYILRFEFEFFKPVPSINPGIAIISPGGQRLFTSHLKDDKALTLKNLDGKVIIDTDLNIQSLAPGIYQVIFGVRDENEQTVIYSNNEVILNIGETNRDKDAAHGLLWHTSNWYTK